MLPPIIDVHTHLHQTPEDTIRFVGDSSPQADLGGRSGTASEAAHEMAAAGIQTMLILPWRVASADLARASGGMDARCNQVSEDWINYRRWATDLSRQSGGRFAALVAVDPVAFGRARTEQMVEEGLSEGAIGLKIAPELIGCRPDDPRMSVVWELASARGLSVTSQCKGGEGVLSHPANFGSIAGSFPDCRIVLAHLGMGGGEYDMARLTGKYPNVFGDTSSWLYRLGSDGAPSYQEGSRILRAIGTDRVMFGSNYPIRDVHVSIRNLERLDLDEVEMAAICASNAPRIHAGVVG